MIGKSYYKELLLAAIAVFGFSPAAVDGIRGTSYNKITLDDDFGVEGFMGVPNPRRPCPKTVSAAALKRAAKKRRNMRARSPK
jgi:hypothetical protein